MKDIKKEKNKLTGKSKRNISLYIQRIKRQREKLLTKGERGKYRDLGIELKGATTILLKIGHVE